MRNRAEIMRSGALFHESVAGSVPTRPGVAGSSRMNMLVIGALGLWLILSPARVHGQLPGSQIRYRINCGGPEIAGTTEFPLAWAEDTQTNPSPYSNHSATNVVERTSTPGRTPSIPEYVPSSLFRYERYGPMQWELPLPAGLHVQVNLFFAETWSGVTGPGQRVFDVSMEGQVVLDNLDVYAEVYSNTQLMKTISVVVGSDGKLDIDFTAVTGDPELNGFEVLTSCHMSDASWQNHAFYPQSAQLEVQYEATPLGSNLDGLVGLSASAGSTYSDFAVLVRFNNTGTIDARDGSVYRADNTISYSPGATYRFRIRVDVPTHRYDVYVLRPGYSYETAIAYSFAFRAEQSGVTALANWGFQCGSGSFEICNFIVRPCVRNTRTGYYYATIQAAIDVAINGDEIVLPPGTYLGDGNRDISCREKSLTIRGSNLADPNVVATTILDPQGSLSDRHRAFNLQSYQTCTFTIAGLTMVNGYAPHEAVNGYSHSAGGAIFSGGVDLVLDHCVLQNNLARDVSSAPYSFDGIAYGGAICCVGPSLTIRDSSLSDNRAYLPERAYDGDTYGGALYADCDQILMERSSVLNNVAGSAGYCGMGHGGGLYCDGAAIISQCTISANTACGSECEASGGGILSHGALTVDGCTFSENVAHGGNSTSGLGGGIGAFGSAQISNSFFARNGLWTVGGGVYCQPGQSTQVTNCTFVDNTGGGGHSERRNGGGAIFGAALVKNCLIMGNIANYLGGGLADCTEVVGCTILGNWSWNYDGGLTGVANVKNCIIWGNGSLYDSAEVAVIPTAQFSCIQHWTSGGPGNFSQDPMLEVQGSGTWTADAVQVPTYSWTTTFTDATRNWAPGVLKGKMLNPDTAQPDQFYVIDNTATTIQVRGRASFALAGAAYSIHGFHLRAGSPCIDTADPRLDYIGQTDIDGEPRVQGYAADVGVDESPNYFPLAPPVNAGASASAICIGNCVRLSATPGTGGNVVDWFAQSCGGLSVNSTQPVCPTSDAFYFARTRNTSTGQVSACLPVWVKVGGEWYAPSGGTNAPVLTLAIHEGQLIAAGDFSGAGGMQASDIAAWDGLEWHTLGSGLGYGVSVVVEYNGDLIAGGDFSDSGGLPLSHLARWDGSTWQSLGSGTDGSVFALTEYAGRLILGGWFTSAGGIPGTSHIAQWNGSTFQPMSSGMDEYVSSLLPFGNGVVAGGYFNTAGGITANRIAFWNGTTWQPLGSGMDGPVRALTLYQNHLIAAGFFSSAGGVACNNIARWNGATWERLGEGTDGSVNSLIVYRGELVAAGSFTNAGGATANKIARWNGTQWLPLTTGMNYDACTLAIYQGELFAGGYFTAAGGHTANYIAGLDCPTCTHAVAADFDSDCDVDGDDLAAFIACGSGPAVLYNPTALPPTCSQTPDGQGRIPADLDRDGDVDVTDFSGFQRCLSGPDVVPEPTCGS